MQNAHFSSSGGAQRPSESTVSRSNTSSKEGVKQKRMKMYHKMKDVHCEKTDISSKSTVVALKSPQELSQTPPRWSPERYKTLSRGLEDVFWKLIVWKPDFLKMPRTKSILLSFQTTPTTPKTNPKPSQTLPRHFPKEIRKAKCLRSICCLLRHA